MAGTFFGLETARRSLKTHQYALHITGHNLANASTPGYTRQEVVLSPTNPFAKPSLNGANTPGQLGTGVGIDMIRRVRDEYLDNNVRRAAADSAYWQEQVAFLQRAEASFAEPTSDGIGQRMVDFFKSWMDLNNTPQNPGIKAAVVQLGDELASMMTYTYNQLDDIAKSIERPKLDVYANRVSGGTSPSQLLIGGNYSGFNNASYLVKIDGINEAGKVTSAVYSTNGGETWHSAGVDEIQNMIRLPDDIEIALPANMSGTADNIYQFNAYSEHAKGKLGMQVERMNEVLREIKDLTHNIEMVYGVGRQPNDLLDKRDLLLEELSSFGPVHVDHATVNGKPTGGLANLTFFGQQLDLKNLKQFSLETDGGKIQLKYHDINLINLTDQCYDTNKGGSLLGLERARQELINYKVMLNGIATNLRDAIKAVNSSPPAADFPDFFTGDLASGDFRVSKVLISNPAFLDGTKAHGVSKLRDTNISQDRPFTFEEYYGTLITLVGGNARSTSGVAANQTAIKAQIEGIRDSVSGVSIDEELTKMIQFQYGFQAASRMVSTIDQMLDVIINRLF